MVQSPEQLSLKKISIRARDRYPEIEEQFNEHLKKTSGSLTNMGCVAGKVSKHQKEIPARPKSPRSAELDKLNDLTEEIQTLKQKAKRFQGGCGENTPEFKILEETGLKIQMKLDDLNVDVEDSLRMRRREAIENVDSILKKLVEKANKQ